MGSVFTGDPRPRIVHLDHTTVRGGAELALVRLLSARTDWRAEVLLPASDPDDVFALLPADVPRLFAGVRQLAGGSGTSPVRLLGLGARLTAQAAATRWHRAVLRSDLVVANSTRAAAYGALAVRASARPFVVHIRDMVDLQSLGAFGYRLMTRLILPRADGVVANSRITLESARPFVREDAVAVSIPSAAGIRTGVAAKRVDGPLRIGMLARIDPWKGQRELLEAFALAFPDGDAQLELVGGAPFEHEDFAGALRRRATELGVAARVHLPGHVDDTAARIATWDIAVQYSTRPEPLGQNVLQYLAGGAATVVADEGGPTEWVDDGRNGLRVPPRSIPQLAEALRRLDADPDLRSRLSALALRTPGLMDDDAVARAHGEAYGEVLTRRRQSAKALS
ncbi:glycosyltransferase [Microbacterium sp.]|uniref:glycosyltransferase n=1 Tax=Microbacterium sp. TaxID=51671 RepID=UPI002811EADF|nr:glycosyltransferase [Microbacterium sp.]